MSSPSFNPWNYKPWWCQPWSIALTGTAIIGGSWMLTKIIWLTVAIALPVLLWMGFFLLVWPKLMRRMVMNANELDRSSE